MAKKTKKELEKEDLCMRRAADTLMRTLSMELYADGSIIRLDEENQTLEHVAIDGNICKYPGYELNSGEILFDVYTNSKNAFKMLMWYLASKGFMFDTLFLTNNRPDTLGHLEIDFCNGVKYKSHIYKKDSLKYLDMILALEQCYEWDFDDLKGIDIE